MNGFLFCFGKKQEWKPKHLYRFTFLIFSEFYFVAQGNPEAKVDFAESLSGERG